MATQLLVPGRPRTPRRNLRPPPPRLRPLGSAPRSRRRTQRHPSTDHRRENGPPDRRQDGHCGHCREPTQGEQGGGSGADRRRGGGRAVSHPAAVSVRYHDSSVRRDLHGCCCGGPCAGGRSGNPTPGRGGRYRGPDAKTRAGGRTAPRRQAWSRYRRVGAGVRPRISGTKTGARQSVSLRAHCEGYARSQIQSAGRCRGRP
mmetsp:Transcript_17750/g.40237  ORF Transcript_17750/g.40237 Transcript_17750/m.40237 type:complete len:202 (-) Transcript_17750:2780-3385(-)